MSSSARFRNAIRISKLCAQGRPPFPKEMIYLCNWYVKLMKPGKEIPKDQFQCVVPLKMNKPDIKNYFEKIYQIKVKNVNTRIQLGKIKSITPGERPMGVGPKGHRKVKRPDYKVAYVTLAEGTFTFPDIFANLNKGEDDDQEQQQQQQQQQQQEQQQ